MAARTKGRFSAPGRLSSLPQQRLYVSSATGPDPHSNPPRYYVLPRSADLAALEAQIAAAMDGGTILTVDFTGPADPGLVVLNGAAVSFAVLCPATPQPDAVGDHAVVRACGPAGGTPRCPLTGVTRRDAHL